MLTKDPNIGRWIQIRFLSDACVTTGRPFAFPAPFVWLQA